MLDRTDSRTQNAGKIIQLNKKLPLFPKHIQHKHDSRQNIKHELIGLSYTGRPSRFSNYNRYQCLSEKALHLKREGKTLPLSSEEL